MELSQVIQKHMITEKSSRLKPSSVYVFAVHHHANRTEVKRAIEVLYKVKVKKVNTVIMHGKMRRVRAHIGQRSDWKKAYVMLQSGQTIKELEV